jgi:photosystem II stability/assembly factor-like uncharacterized protein
VSKTRLLAAAVAIWLGGSVSCVDTTKKTVGTCVVAPPVPYAGSAPIPSAGPPPAGSSSPAPYNWSNVVIGGGGFVTGIIVSPTLPDLVFARTDVGGAYRYDPSSKSWMPITDWAGHNTSSLMGIESIALDPVDPNRVYIAAGEYLTSGNGSILSSTDMGQTWTQNSISAPMGGNVDGRSMGERLAVDPNMPSTLYFGSRNAGLWKSTDSGTTWTKVTGFPTVGATSSGAGSGNAAGAGYGLTFVLFDPQSGSPGAPTPAIYVGVGVTTDTALYASNDAGQTWAPVAGQPAMMMPHHAVLDRCGSIYLTYNNGSGPNGVTMGAVWRYSIADGQWTDVSPPGGKTAGFGGISVDASSPGTLLVTTIDRWPGEVYRTKDGGHTWKAVAAGAARDLAGADWLLRHTSSMPVDGWLGDVEIDPFNSARAFYITGQGLWSSQDVTMADSGAITHWSFEDAGLEETVVLDLATPPTGAPLLSGVGDIAGFRHDDLTVSPPDGMFANPIFGNTTSLDFAEGAPSIVARVGTNSAGTRGAFSTDGGTTWTPFAGLPSGGTTCPPPNPPTCVASGSIAVSADGATFVWAPAGGTASYSRDNGATWTASTGLAAGMQVSSDRVNPSKFYATITRRNNNRMVVSSDGGVTFTQVTPPALGRPRTVFGNEGDVWLPTNTGLLHSQDSGMTFMPVPQVNGATAVGFGRAAMGQTYPAVYVAGSVGGVWGTYRSDDSGMTWTRIDDPQHQFGFINILAGDQNQYGRVYLGTGGRGIVYGDPQQ